VELSPESKWLGQITGSGEHKLKSAYDVAVDRSSGNIWVADYYGEVVAEFNTKGEYIRRLIPSEIGAFWQPWNVAVDSKGYVWANGVSSDPKRILKFKPNGERDGKKEISDTNGGLITDSEGNLWVSNPEKDRLDKYSSEGVYLGQIGEGLLGGADEAIISTKGDFWVSNGQYVEGLNAKGEYLGKFSNGHPELGGPKPLAAAANGNLWLGLSTNGGQIQKWSRSVSFRLSGMPVTEPFDGGTTSKANYSANWSKLGWAAEKGNDTTTGWRANGSYPVVNGAYFNSTITDTGTGTATVATLTENPGNEERYFSAWLDASGSSSIREGYELRFVLSGTNKYNVTLSKWKGGTQTVLASKTGYSFAIGSSFALVDQGGTVSAWTGTGSEFAQLLSASDATFASGKAGIEAAGNITKLNNFKAGVL
jgi:hypothetical protein